MLPGQLDLLELIERKPTLARHGDPQTSHEAAARVDTSKDEAMVVAALMKHGPMTSKELAVIANRRRENISPRFAPLERGGLIEKDGRRDGCTVWRMR